MTIRPVPTLLPPGQGKNDPPLPVVKLVRYIQHVSRAEAKNTVKANLLLKVYKAVEENPKMGERMALRLPPMIAVVNLYGTILVTPRHVYTLVIGPMRYTK